MSEVFFGGPDKPAGALRDLLEARVRAVPVGGSIHWATYYLRDRRLAEALMAASDRGVKVLLRIEGRPRNTAVSRHVIEMLQRHGLGGGFHLHLSELRPKQRRYLHAKVYAFSDPVPSALVGSYNPSGDSPEDPEILADIGDQDRGHNMLVEYTEPRLVDRMFSYVAGLGGWAEHLRRRRITDGPTTIFFYPRLRPNILGRQLARLDRGARVRAAISHMKGNFLAPDFVRAARRGVSVRLVVHDTGRRVANSMITKLEDAGVEISRYVQPEGLPLHAKFLLIETATTRSAWFGSLNYNRRSGERNHEVLVRSRDPAVYNSIAARMGDIESELFTFADVLT